MKPTVLTLFIAFFYITTNPLFAQQLTVEPSPGKKEESFFRFRFFKSGLLGFNSIGHLTVSGSGLLNLRYSGKKGSFTEFDLSSTYSPLFLNSNDQRNAVSHLLNPLGGLVNVSLRYAIPLHIEETTASKLTIRTGLKLVEAFPIKAIDGQNFLDQYAEVGWLYQNLIAEDALQNQSLYFMAYPHFFVHHSGAEQRASFFGQNLPPTAQGYGVELALDFNRRLWVSLTGSQFVNATVANNLQKFVLALTVGVQLLK